MLRARFFISTSRLAVRPWIGPIALTAALLAAIYGFSPNFRAASSADASPYGGDFLQEWIGGHIVRAGNYERFYDVAYAQELEHDPSLVGFHWDEGRYLPMVYPPFYYAAVSPLSWLSFHAAAWVWAGLMVGCLVGSAALLLSLAGGWRRSLGDAPANTAECHRGHSLQNLLPWLLPASLLFMPLIESLTSSQKGTACLLILTATYALLNSKRPFFAGLVYGLLAFKPQLTLVIAFVMLFKGQWRFVIGGATTGLVLVAVSLLLGLDVCGQYVDFATGTADYLHTSGYDLSKSHCLYGFFALANGGQAGIAVKVVTFVSISGVLALLAFALRGEIRPKEPHFALQFSALVIASLLASPHLFTYDLTILLLPMCLIGAAIYQGTIRQRRRMLLGWLLAATFALAGLSPAIAAQSGVQITTLLMLALLALVAYEAGQGRGATSFPAACESEAASCPSQASQ